MSDQDHSGERKDTPAADEQIGKSEGPTPDPVKPRQASPSKPQTMPASDHAAAPARKAQLLVLSRQLAEALQELSKLEQRLKYLQRLQVEILRWGEGPEGERGGAAPRVVAGDVEDLADRVVQALADLTDWLAAQHVDDRPKSLRG